MKSFFLMLLTLTALVSCATSHRDPAAVQEEKTGAHENYRGVFDRPMN
jgi:hypothetical protein